jgi:hypothetical protein
MGKTRSRQFFFVIWVGITGNFILFPSGPQVSDGEKLRSILEKTAEYCEKLKGLALHFVCEEKIQERTFTFKKSLLFKRSREKRGYELIEDLGVDKTAKKSYVYDYQMIKKGDDFKELRNLLAENGKKKNERNVKLKTVRMSSKFLVFGPVGFLSQYWQRHFNYKIIGSENVGSRVAVVIRAYSKETREENDNSGTIWIDEADCSILKIEWEPRSISHFVEKAESSVGELKRKMTWTVSYDIIHKGVRFPSRQLIKESYITKAGKEHLKYEATYSYENYKYFIVETEVNWQPI